MPDYAASDKRIARNTIFLYIRMFVVLVISLYVTRAVFNALGVVDFGIYNVVAGFVSFFTFLEATLSGSVQRFYNYYGTREGEDGFCRIYSAGILISAICAGVLLLLLETAGLWYVNNVMVIPEDRIVPANVIFQFVTASFMLLFLQLPFVGMIMAKENMNFYALVSVGEAMLKLAMALMLPHVSCDHLIFYGLAMFLISLSVCLMMVVHTKRSFRFLHFSRKFDSEVFRPLLDFSGWTFVGSFAFMLKGQGLNLLLNSFFGPVVNAARGIAFQVSNAVNGFSTNVSMAFRPQIVNSYAEQDMQRCCTLMFRESRICFALIALLMVPLTLEIGYILHLWLGGDVPEDAQAFTALVLLDSLVCTLNAPCTQIVYATGKIRTYQILSTVVNLLLLPVCLLFLKLGYRAISVFIFTVIFSVINQAVCTVVAGRTAGFRISDYLVKVLLPCLSVSLTVILPYLVVRYMDESFARLMAVLAAMLVSSVPVMYYLVLDRTERTTVNARLSKMFNWRHNDE